MVPVPRIGSPVMAGFHGGAVIQGNLIPGFRPRSIGMNFRAGVVQQKPSLPPGVDAFPVTLQKKMGGTPIPDNVRRKMEYSFGTDFSDVRIHVGQEARSIGAIAFTWGSDIHFAPGFYHPDTFQGQQLLGHELTHVLQQRSGRVQNPFGAGTAVVQDMNLESEADRMGLKAALTMVPGL
jgi:Domain of unknown function (DUF4157)